MKKLAAIFTCMLMLAALPGYRAEAAISVEEFFNLCESGTPQQIEAAIQAGADVNAQNNGDVTPLMVAASNNNNPEVLKVLIQAGADVNAYEKFGETALTMAAQYNNNPEVVSLLIQAGARDIKPAFAWAAWDNSNPEVLKVLIQAGADVNAKDFLGVTPIMRAAQYNNNPEVLRVLIQAGADVNAKNSKGETALDLARARNKPEFVSILQAPAAGPGAAASDAGYVRLAIKGTNVNLRPGPRTSGSVVAQMNTGDVFIAEKNPVINDDDNSQWYKIVLAADAGTIKISALPEMDSRFNNDVVFVRADFATISPLKEGDMERILAVQAANNNDWKKLNYVTKAMLIGKWIANDDNPDLRTTYTFNSDDTGVFTFFDGALNITEYSVTFDSEYAILSYTMIAAEGEYHLTQEPVNMTYHLEYISNDEFAVIESKDNYKRER